MGQNRKKHRLNSRPIIHFPTSERTSEWSTTYIWVFDGSGPLCVGGGGPVEIHAGQLARVVVALRRVVLMLTGVRVGAGAVDRIGGARFGGQHALVHVEDHDQATEQDRTDDGALFVDRRRGGIFMLSSKQ